MLRPFPLLQLLSKSEKKNNITCNPHPSPTLCYASNAFTTSAIMNIVLAVSGRKRKKEKQHHLHLFMSHRRHFPNIHNLLECAPNFEVFRSRVLATSCQLSSRNNISVSKASRKFVVVFFFSIFYFYKLASGARNRDSINGELRFLQQVIKTQAIVATQRANTVAMFLWSREWEEIGT